MSEEVQWTRVGETISASGGSGLPPEPDIPKKVGTHSCSEGRADGSISTNDRRYAWGSAIEGDIDVYDDGTWWAGCSEYMCPVNFCPWCGEPAPSQVVLLR